MPDFNIAWNDYCKDQSDENKTTLKDAYEAIPEDERIFCLGDQDLKDFPVREVLYGPDDPILAARKKMFESIHGVTMKDPKYKAGVENVTDWVNKTRLRKDLLLCGTEGKPTFWLAPEQYKGLKQYEEFGEQLLEKFPTYFDKPGTMDDKMEQCRKYVVEIRMGEKKPDSYTSEYWEQMRSHGLPQEIKDFIKHYFETDEWAKYQVTTVFEFNGLTINRNDWYRSIALFCITPDGSSRAESERIISYDKTKPLNTILKECDAEEIEGGDVVLEDWFFEELEKAEKSESSS